jgi:hypothetical protein
MSADIVGSTAFKQGSIGESQWFHVVLRFYQLAEAELMRHWALGQVGPAKGAELDALYGEPPTLWKTIGDEVTFSKRITHPAQAMSTLHAWISALGELRILLKKHQLDVKASAWLADFPLRNREVALRLGPEVRRDDVKLDDEYLHWRNENLLQEYIDKNGVGLIKDYVGPSIDTGFRLSANASPRRLAISIELGYLLAGESTRLEGYPYKIGSFQMQPLVFRYDNMTSLKGVLSGAPYPFIWIDVLPKEPLNVAEDELRGVVSPPPEKVWKFAREYMAAYPNKLCSLYMHSDLEVPDEFAKISQESVDELIKKQTQFQQLDDALKEEKNQNLSADNLAAENPAETNPQVAKAIIDTFARLTLTENAKK